MPIGFGLDIRFPDFVIAGSFLALDKVPIGFGLDIRFPDFVIDGSQSCDLKSKIGLSHITKLDELNCVTKPKIRFEIFCDRCVTHNL